MDVKSIPIMAALKERMSYLNENQQVVAQNIANADTPGYRAKELDPQNFSSLISDLDGRKTTAAGAKPFVMKATHAAHIGAQENRQPLPRKDVEDYEEGLDGNAVVLEEEMIKLADTQMKYGMAVNMYKKHIGLMKIAIGKGGQG